MHDIISLSISKISVIFQRFVWNEIGFDLFIEKNRGCVCFNIFIQHWNPIRSVNQNRYNYLYKLTLSVALSDAHLTGDHWFDHHQFRNILKCWLIMKYFLLVILSRWFKKDFLSVSAILTANHNNCRLLCHLLVILSHFCKQCGPWEQSDQGPHCLPVCKNRFEKFARIFSRHHKQTTFSDADNIFRCRFLFDALKVKEFAQVLVNGPGDYGSGKVCLGKVIDLTWPY